MHKLHSCAMYLLPLIFLANQQRNIFRVFILLVIGKKHQPPVLTTRSYKTTVFRNFLFRYSNVIFFIILWCIWILNIGTTESSNSLITEHIRKQIPLKEWHHICLHSIARLPNLSYQRSIAALRYDILFNAKCYEVNIHIIFCACAIALIVAVPPEKQICCFKNHITPSVKYF